ncbi:LapA family protein [Shewanella cyperi]|uniref:Probable lipopolysaccharide assembly protein A n=1 Tax=Shewanella cyperi TaxID=2814292 RepID=A0A974XNM8_9GAMM|nr:LapA family protein [Shewanella cyperi]QSX31714.1 LapA family protein [Shewanella cyperi]
MKAFFVTVIVALLFFLALLLGARNEQMVTISYFVAQGEFRLPVVLASVFLAGFLLCWLFAIYHITRLKLALAKARRKLSKLESATVAETVTTEGEVKS